MKQIPLRRRDGSVRAYALVDDDDFEQLNARRWCLLGDAGYVARGEVRRVNGTKTHRTIYMHREILGLIPGCGLEADHINGDKLDNRRCNLRVATRAQNAQNRHSVYAQSGRRGVTWHARDRLWCAAVGINGRRVVVGYFKDKEAAAAAAAAFRAEHMPFSSDARSRAPEITASTT